ncbi:uncharacterized protein F5147DRAFT_577082, partial [Suillus discolor]
HQLVSILRLVDTALDNELVMLMDEVGVGKTMHAVGLITCLGHYREHYRKHTSSLEKLVCNMVVMTAVYTNSYLQPSDSARRLISDLPTVIMRSPNLYHQWMSEI